MSFRKSPMAPRVSVNFIWLVARVCVQEEEPQTTHPLSFTYTSDIAASVHYGMWNFYLTTLTWASRIAGATLTWWQTLLNHPMWCNEMLGNQFGARYVELCIVYTWYHQMVVDTILVEHGVQYQDAMWSRCSITIEVHTHSSWQTMCENTRTGESLRSGPWVPRWLSTRQECTSISMLRGALIFPGH